MKIKIILPINTGPPFVPLFSETDDDDYVPDHLPVSGSRLVKVMA